MKHIMDHTTADNNDLTCILNDMLEGSEYVIGDFKANITFIGRGKDVMIYLKADIPVNEGVFAISADPLVNGYYENGNIEIQEATLLILYKLGKLFKTGV